MTTGTAELARAVLEGVAANSRWLFGHVEKFCGRPLSPVRMVGGGAQSAVWCQIFADALDRPVEQVPEPMYAQLRGMAALAAVALGERTLADVDSLRPRGAVFEPDAAGVEAMADVTTELDRGSTATTARGSVGSTLSRRRPRLTPAPRGHRWRCGRHRDVERHLGVMSDDRRTDDTADPLNDWNRTIISEFRANEGRVGGRVRGRDPAAAPHDRRQVRHRARQPARVPRG